MDDEIDATAWQLLCFKKIKIINFLGVKKKSILRRVKLKI